MSDFNVEKALEYIDEHIEEKLFLKDIAESLGYSPFYVSRMFSQKMGISIVSYIRMRKLQFAFSSLQKSKSVLEVACQYGFESHEGFTRSFKRFYGFSPKDVKNQKAIQLTSMDYAMKEREIEMMNGRNMMEEVHKMLFLLLRESIVEMKAGHCSKISVSLLPNNCVEIADDGRGIPLTVENSNAMLSHIFGAHPMSTLEYSNLEDFNNLELNMVNSLCERMSVCVWRNGKSYSQDYMNGIAQRELHIENYFGHSGMKVLLKPNSSIFGEAAWSKEMIEKFVAQHAPECVESILVECYNE